MTIFMEYSPSGRCAKPGKCWQKRETLALSLGLTNEAAVGFAL
jgi:hypothetical protein